MHEIPAKHEIIESYENIRANIHYTPLLTSSYIDKIANGNIVFKCENFQKVGAFKFRGATNAVLKLSEIHKQSGVATHSSGNHAQALALAAHNAGVKAYIVMPENSKQVKINAVKGYGADVIFCKPTLKSREDTLEQVVARTGAYFIHPYDNYDIIEGQATAALELVRDKTDLDYVIVPVGGGGLLAGTALSVNYFSNSTKVIAAEPTGADDAYRSFKSGRIIPSVNPDTIADGLLTSLGERNFPIVQKFVSDVLVVDDTQIINAMRMVWERMKIIIEPSSAVPLAAVLSNKGMFKNKKVGIIISGGNVDLENLPF